MNPMREVFVDKVVVHMGVGESGDKLTKAVDIMKKITGNNPVKSVAKKTNPAFGIRKGAPISWKVTLRGRLQVISLILHLLSLNGRSVPASLTRVAIFPSVSKNIPIFPACRMTRRSGFTGWMSTLSSQGKESELHDATSNATVSRKNRWSSLRMLSRS